MKNELEFKDRIRKEMHEFEKILKYRFNDITLLETAMSSIRIKTNNPNKSSREYSNESLATVGDAILKAIIADYFYDKMNFKTKKEITIRKSEIEDNETMHRLMLNEKWIDFSYNRYHFFKDKDIPKHQMVSSKAHDPYVEAIVAAIYYDSGFDKTKEWVYRRLLPLLKKYR